MSIPWKALVPIAGGAAFVIALVVLHHVLAAYNYHELLHDLRALSLPCLLAALGLTIIDYWALTAYDALSLTAIGGQLAYPKVAATAFMAFSCSHNLGYAVISGGAIRWRYYTSYGLKPAQIAGITILGGISYIFGFVVIAALTSLAWPPAAAASWLSHGETRAVGAGALVLVLGLVAALLARRRPWRWREWTLPAPHVRTTLVLLVVGCLDWVLAACVVWVLLPNLGDLGFVQFVGIFILAGAAGNLSQVPGGLGVLEASLLVMLSGRASVGALAGALLAFRAIYYLLPLLSALGLMGVIEAVRHSRKPRPGLLALSDGPNPGSPA